jgi:hypothetical protein
MNTRVILSEAKDLTTAVVNIKRASRAQPSWGRSLAVFATRDDGTRQLTEQPE